MKKRFDEVIGMTYGDLEETEEDFYSEATLEDLSEDDEISGFEAGFMAGYNLE
jgi:hypothetical protein